MKVATQARDVVLVEDDPHDARLILRVLQKQYPSHHIALLRDGAEAMASFSAPDAVLPKVIMLDLKLPKLTGLEVLRRLRADDRTRAVPVVILTSSRLDQDLRAAYDLGANSFVTKPIAWQEFNEVVTELAEYWIALNQDAGEATASTSA